MSIDPLLHHRLACLRLAGPPLDTAADAVDWLVAVQAQDYAAAKWSLGLRLAQGSDALVERAFNDGAILRTHLLRPTWHFVAPADIRWLLALTAPRVHALNGSFYRRFGIDDEAVRRLHRALTEALQGGNARTRDELMVRVGPEQYGAALAQPHARMMDFTGRPMTGMVMVAAEGLGSGEHLAAWVRQGVAYAGSLPAK